MLFNVVWYQPAFALNLVKVSLISMLFFCFLKISLPDISSDLKFFSINLLYSSHDRDKKAHYSNPNSYKTTRELALLLPPIYTTPGVKKIKTPPPQLPVGLCKNIIVVISVSYTTSFSKLETARRYDPEGTNSDHS